MTTPCATCVTLADCSTCPAFDAYLAATEPPTPPRCYVCEDVVLLLDCGELLETIAPRIRTRQGTRFTLPALQRHLRDHQRRDLIERDMRRQGFSDAEVGAR